MTMKSSALVMAALILSTAVPSQARHHHFCLRFNKTTGTAAGAVAGGLIAKGIVGGPVGIIAGAAAGGIAGNKLAHNRAKHCRHD